MISRENYIKSIIPFIDTDLIKVLTDVRRSGKSFMLRLIQKYLINNGVKENQFIDINFEELKYNQYKDYLELKAYLENQVELINHKTYIFMR